LKDYLIYLLFLFVKLLVKILPVFIIKPILNFLGFIAYYVDKRHRQVAYANLDFVYEDSISQDVKEKIIKESYQNMVYNLHDFIYYQGKPLEFMEKNIVIDDDSSILNAIKEDKNIILVTAHYGSWELAIPYVSLKYRPISVISKPVKNKYLHEFLLKARAAHNLQMFEKHGAAKKMVKAIREKRIVAMAVDQNIKQRGASIVEFYGKKVTQVDAPVRLAHKLNAVIIPMMFIRDGFDKHRVKFFDEIIVPKEDLTEESVQAFSQQISNTFETQIKEKPNDWFWQHRRFKEFYGGIYR
jgi:KDO2-lipid IV(A) lauroyltransferase